MSVRERERMQVGAREDVVEDGGSSIGEFGGMDVVAREREEEERPRDDEIQAFHNQIRAADAEKLEFVGDKVGFLSHSVSSFSKFSRSPKIGNVRKMVQCLMKRTNFSMCFFSHLFPVPFTLLVFINRVEDVAIA